MGEASNVHIKFWSENWGKKFPLSSTLYASLFLSLFNHVLSTKWVVWN